MIIIVSTAVVLILTALLYLGFVPKKKKFNISGRHVLISGGSKGIGKEVAAQCYQKGAKITILARNEQDLIKVKEYILDHSKKDRRENDISYFSVDVAKDYQALEKIVTEAEEKLGPIYGVFNIVGRAVCHRFMETPLEDFDSMMRVNYHSAVNCTRAVLKGMTARKEGFIEMTSSMAGLFGIYGFTAYSSSKFALVGFAQSLAMEVKPTNISVTVAFPPDTDTPGFAIENQTKPLETKLICESAGLLPPSQVAQSIINDTLEGKFSSTIGLEGFLLRTLNAGMSPPNGLTSVILESALMGPLRLVAILILTNFNKIVRDCAVRRTR